MKSAITKHKISAKVEPCAIVESDPFPDAENRINCIATAAYYMAEARGFTPGQELDDWLEAEEKFAKRKGH